MERRKFLTTAVLGGAATTTGLATPAVSSGTKTITIVSTWPRDMPGVGTSAQRLVERINQLSGGSLHCEYYAAGERIGAFDSFDEVANGNADAYIGPDYYWKGKHPGLAFYTTVPFGLGFTEQTAWYYHGGGKELEDKLKGEFGLKGMFCANLGQQMAGWFNKKVETLDDLQGFKMRTAGLGGDVMARLGMSTVSVPGGQIYESLVSGAIDGAEWLGPYGDYWMKFYEAAKYYYSPGYLDPQGSISMTFNASFWSQLTDYERAIIENATKAEYVESYAEISSLNGEYLTKMIEENGVKTMAFPEEVGEAFGETAIEVMAEVRDHSALAAEISDSYRNAMRNIGGYQAISTIAVANTRNAVYEIGPEYSDS